MKGYNHKSHSFPSKFGFSGSAGKVSVRPHTRSAPQKFGAGGVAQLRRGRPPAVASGDPDYNYVKPALPRTPLPTKSPSAVSRVASVKFPGLRGLR